MMVAAELMSDLAQHGIDLPTPCHMFDLWCAGAKKSDLERRFLDKPESPDKPITSLVREHLGAETERRSTVATERDALKVEVLRLRALLSANGLEPGTSEPLR